MVRFGLMRGARTESWGSIPSRWCSAEGKGGSADVPPRQEGSKTGRELGPPEEAGVHRDTDHQGRHKRWETPNDLHGPAPRPWPYRRDSIGGNGVNSEEWSNGLSVHHRMSFCAGMSTEIGASIRYR
jgi:hypothetical protein